MNKKNYNPDLLEEVEDVAKNTEKKILKWQRPIFRKYPLTFTLLSITGFSAVLYGFERAFDMIPYLNEHPLVVLFIGLVILTLTGTIYKWLQNKEINIS